MDITEVGISISIVSLAIAVLRQTKNNSNNGHLTVSDGDKRWTEINVCKEIHKRADDKLDCIPEIKEAVTRLETKMDILLNNR